MRNAENIEKIEYTIWRNFLFFNIFGNYRNGQHCLQVWLKKFYWDFLKNILEIFDKKYVNTYIMYVCICIQNEKCQITFIIIKNDDNLKHFRYF